jgi:hypothetical protein
MQKTMIKLNLINPEEIYQSISKGNPFNRNLKLFTKIEVESAIRQFISSEEYEKCSVLQKFIDKRFSHDLGYLSPLTF